MGARQRSFSTLADFVAWWEDEGVVDEEDLLDNHHGLLAPMFHGWTSQGQTGCQFARHLAKNADDAGWFPVVLSNHTDATLGADANEIVGGAGSADNVEAVLLLFPSVRSVEDLATLIGTLCAHDAWTWVEIDPAGDGLVRVGLRWAVPDTDLVSWVLAFGDIESQPYTRRSPVTALTIRTRPPANDFGGLDLAKINAHLDQPVYDRFMAATKRDKAMLLNGEFEDGARARVTARIPVDYASLLGPAAAR